MSDPGWDVPGVDRDAAASGGLLTETSPAASTADGSGSRPGRKGRKTQRDGSVSAAFGLSAGAFAPASGPASAGDTAAQSSAAGSAAAAGSAPSSAAGSAADYSDGPAGSPAAASAQHESGSGPAAGSSASDYFTGTAGTPSDDAADTGSASGSGSAAAGCGTPGGSAAGGVRPSDAAQALAFVSAGLEFLAGDDPAAWSEGLQADCLRAFAVAESRQTAAHAKVLAAFSVPGGGLNGDGHRSPRAWLSWQARATKAAAGAQVAWMRRLNAHPDIASALAAATISASWARQIIAWSDRLPEDARDSADRDFLAAAGGGADLDGLAGLANDLQREHATPDGDDDGFEDRKVRLDQTFEGAGRLTGDLTPGCATAAQTVLDALGRARGPEDDRTQGQRWHDALEEAFLLLLGSDCLPQRAGQPVRLELGITLAELLNGDRDGRTCDATIDPVITGHVDYNLLAKLTDQDQELPFDTRDGDEAGAAVDDLSDGTGNTGDGAAAAGRGGDYGLLAKFADPDSPQAARLREAARQAHISVASAGLEDVLAGAVALLSGPEGVAMALRRKITGIPLASVSLPLDIASAFDTIPAHLRRAVRKRDRHCRFPGCDVPAARCDVHHIVWRSKGGRHALTNMLLLCRYHHHVAIHRCGWVIVLHADGTTTAVSPDGSKTLHDHPPPIRAA
jgi:hypothetical protein